MSRKPREAIIFLLDVSKNMSQLSDVSGASFFQSSKECISQIIQRKIFSNARDELALIIFGCEKTENALATNNEYRNIAVVTENLQYPNWDLLKYVLELEYCNDKQGDWLDAIVVAMNFMKEKTSSFQSVFHFKIVLFSNFGCPVFDDQLGVIAAGMNDANIKLVVIGPDVHRTEHSPGTSKSEIQKVGENLILKLVEKVKGVVCSFNEAFPELMYFQRKNVKPTPWNALFTISDQIKLPIQMFKKVTEPSYRKWTTRPLDDVEAGVDKERGYIKFDDDKEKEVEVPKTDIINAYQFGSTVVPFSDIDKESMRYMTGEKGLFFIGATRKDLVPFHLLIGDGSYIVLTRPDDDVAKVAFEAFVQVLFEKNCVGIARRIYSTNTSTNIGALFPVVTEESKYLVFAQLPFAEDEHLYKFPSLADVKPSEEQIKAVDNLIEMMDLDPTDTEPEKYDITKIYDHNEQYIFKCLSYKALYPDRPLPDELVKNSLTALKPDANLLEACQVQLKRIKNEFPIEEVPEKSKRKAFKKYCTINDNDGTPVSTSLFVSSSTTPSMDSSNDHLISLPRNEPSAIDKLDTVDENAVLNGGHPSKSSASSDNQNEDVDSQYGSQTSECIDDLLDNI